MVYDYDDDSEIPDFSEFRDELIEELMCSALFQQKTGIKFNMLKIPVVMPPCLLGKKVNSEKLKKTIMEKEFSFEDETIMKFQQLVEKKVIKINSIKDLTVKQLEAFGAQLGILGQKKSGEMLKVDLINLSNIFLGGQVVYI